MKVVRIISVALTLLVVAMVSPSRAATVVEFFLEPVAGSGYTYQFTAGSTDTITTNTVSTANTTGMIYFDVYAGMSQNDATQTTGSNYAYMSFTSTGNIGTASSGSPASVITMPSQNGLFATSGLSSTGTSQDLNGDHNLDLGSTVNTSANGWVYFNAGSGAYALVRGRRPPAPYSNILLGEIAYSYTPMPPGLEFDREYRAPGERRQPDQFVQL